MGTGRAYGRREHVYILGVHSAPRRSASSERSRLRRCGSATFFFEDQSMPLEASSTPHGHGPRLRQAGSTADPHAGASALVLFVGVCPSTLQLLGVFPAGYADVAPLPRRAALYDNETVQGLRRPSAPRPGGRSTSGWKTGYRLGHQQGRAPTPRGAPSATARCGPSPRTSCAPCAPSSTSARRSPTCATSTRAGRPPRAGCSPTRASSGS